MRIVLDTNVLVSGIFWKGPPREIVVLWSRGAIDLMATPPILDEYNRVIGELGERFPSVPAGRLVEQIVRRCTLIRHVAAAPVRCSDPADQKFLDAAAGRVPYLVTGDRALLAVQSYPGGRVITPRVFLSEFH